MDVSNTGPMGFAATGDTFCLCGDIALQVENPHVQRLKKKLSPYLFKAVWHAGKHLCIPEALSQAPVSHPMPEDKIPAADVVTYLRIIITINNINSKEYSSLHNANRTLQDLHTTARMGPLYTILLEAVTSGLPSNQNELSAAILPCWTKRDSLYADGKLVLYRQRLWFLLLFTATPSLACMTVKEVWKPRSIEQDKQLSGLASFLTLRILSVPVIYVRCCSPANCRNPSCVMTTPANL
ncbi:hypothetical protein SK128_016590 [Halocaridina rubra]|uniref:Uncharacterized protein n=1 Tax=Halocaridina rubra TaxID=373956 RepID=A0AAN9AG14_HALRR